MKFLRIICVLLFHFSALVIYAKEYSETLQSRTKDKLTINYDVSTRDGNVTISFVKLRKQIGFVHSDKYNDLSKVKVLFFERNGRFQNDQFISNITTEALTIKSDELVYSPTDEGYVWLDDQPELHLKLRASESGLSIPVYMAYYKKKHVYEVFAYCGNLNISLSQVQHQSPNEESVHNNVNKRTNVIEESFEVERDLSPNELAIQYIAQINEIIGQGDDLSIPDYFDTYMSELRKIGMTIADPRLRKDIDEVLKKAEAKKKAVEQTLADANQRAEEEKNQIEMENDIRSDLEYLNERLSNSDKLSESDIAELKGIANELRRKSHSMKDSELKSQMKDAADRCDDVMKNLEDSKKKRNLWMIIGGILLAVLMFISNHALQYFRNLRNQKGIEEMQEKMVKRAEDEARRKAGNTIRSKIDTVQNRAIGKGRDAVRKGINGSVGRLTKDKGNKNFTI